MASTGEQVRTVLVGLHVLAITLMALPAPGGAMSRSAWKKPTVQAEFAAWRGRLASWGVELSPEEFEDGLWDLSVQLMGGREVMLAPFDWYYLYCGTWQSWRMFVAPHTHPSRLYVDIYEDGAWRPVYVGRSPEHDWMADVFDHDRMRSATFRYAWRKYAGTYTPFTKWIAKRGAVDFPDAEKLRVRYQKGPTPSPEQTLAGEPPETTFVLQRVHALGAYR